MQRAPRGHGSDACDPKSPSSPATSERVTRNRADAFSEGDKASCVTPVVSTLRGLEEDNLDWELSLALLLERLPDAVHVIGSDGRHLLNRAALTLMGFESADSVPRDLSTLARELNVRQRDTRIPLALEQLPHWRALRGEVCVEELVIRQRTSGLECTVRYVAAPILRRGKTAGAICIGSDITQRISAETSERKRAEFEQQLIGIVSHDLRNPLQVIRFAAGVGARASSADAKQTRHFERILSASDRALRMVDDLLDFTRIRFTGGIEIERSLLDLHALTAQITSEVLTTRPERQIELEAHGDGRGEWDPDRLAQVLQNLISNALQHTTEDTRVRVASRGEEDYVVIEVHNGGAPIPQEDQGRIFEPFWRGRGAKGRTGRSMGLGLHIASHLVHAHQGTLRLVSNEQAGTTFTVRLPRHGVAPKD